MNPIVWLIVAALIALGVLAYLGIWKQWMRTPRGYGTYMGFCLLYIGVALALAGLAVELDAVRSPLGVTLLVVAVLLLIVAIVGFWWLPSFLQPAWFRRQREGRR